ncbi:hypothetical protein [Cetobacterium sp.]|uniref:hypothetical protein n=1 Tax=Cetobacterium sp. TaxID=2071632 RepID=UPI003F312924
MLLDHEEIEQLLVGLSKKTGINLDEDITLSDIIKKVQNQNLCYKSSANEINILKPTQKNAFFIKNASFNIDDKEFLTIDKDEIISVKMISDKKAIIKTFDKTKKIEYTGNNIKVKIERELPIDVYLDLIGG